MPRWLKTVVVIDVEKAHKMRQAGIGKTVRSPHCGDRTSDLHRFSHNATSFGAAVAIGMSSCAESMTIRSSGNGAASPASTNPHQQEDESPMSPTTTGFTPPLNHSRIIANTLMAIAR
jgi:protein required for attachment to host cells